MRERCLLGHWHRGQDNGDLSDGQRAYVAAIAAEREATDLKMRDEYWSPLAVTDMVLLDTKPVSIDSEPTTDLVLEGQTVVPHHAKVILESVGGSVRYMILGVDGPDSIDSDGGGIFPS